jgi:hypothetical protein
MSWNYDHDVWGNAHDLLRHAAEQQTSKTPVTAFSDRDGIRVHAMSKFQDLFGGVAPSRLRMDIQRSHAPRAFRSGYQNSLRMRVNNIADVFLKRGGTASLRVMPRRINRSPR